MPNSIGSAVSQDSTALQPCELQIVTKEPVSIATRCAIAEAADAQGVRDGAVDRHAAAACEQRAHRRLGYTVAKVGLGDDGSPDSSSEPTTA